MAQGDAGAEVTAAVMPDVMVGAGDRGQSEEGSEVQDVMPVDQREAPGGSEGGPYPISTKRPDGSHRVAPVRTTRHDRVSMKRRYTPSQKSATRVGGAEPPAALRAAVPV